MDGARGLESNEYARSPHGAWLLWGTALVVLLGAVAFGLAIARIDAEPPGGSDSQKSASADPPRLLKRSELSGKSRHEVAEAIEVELLAVRAATTNEGRLARFRNSATAARFLRDAFAPLSGEERIQVGKALYEEACALSHLERPRDALLSLQEGVEAGWADAGLIETDPRLQALRELPEFAAELGGLRARAVEHLRRRLAEGRFRDLDFAVTALDGRTVSTAGQAGRVMLVECWGTWCLPCLQMTPHFVQLQRKYPEEELLILGLAFENARGEEAERGVRDYLAKSGIKFPCALVTADTPASVPRPPNYPTVLFIGPDGRTRLVLDGYQSSWVLESVVELLLEEQ
jgi:thiol-disulfide isomerase/thioredoxin